MGSSANYTQIVEDGQGLIQMFICNFLTLEYNVFTVNVIWDLPVG